MRRTKRAIRRHHYSRLVKKYAATSRGWVSFSEEDHLNRGRIMATTAQVCSCHGCGNARTSWGGNCLTMQERRMEHNEAEGREEAGERFVTPRKGSIVW